MGQGNIKAIKGIWIPTYIDTVTKPLCTTGPRRCLVDSVVACSDRVLVEVFRLVVYSVFKF